MSASVLLTGGMGYVGGRIAQALAEQTNLTLRLSSRTPPASRPDWLARGEVVTMDLFNDESLQHACHGTDCIVHLAALNEIDSAQDPVQALKINAQGTLRLLQAAKKTGVKRFIYFSTAHLYGAPLAGDIDETTLPRPVHPYAITHRSAEDFVLAAHGSGALTGLVVRLSNGLGAPAHAAVNRWTLIGNDLCRQAVQTGALQLRSSGLQWRDFVALSDVAAAALHFLHLPESQCGDGIFNLGGAKAMRVIDLAHLIAQRCGVVLGFVPPVTHHQPQAGEINPQLNYRIDKLLSTGFKLQGSLEEEIDATLALCQRNFGKLR